jgi:hypothetical protein
MSFRDLRFDVDSLSSCMIVLKEQQAGKKLYCITTKTQTETQNLFLVLSNY